MKLQPILNIEDSREVAANLIGQQARSLFSTMDFDQLANGEQSFSVSWTRSDGSCEEIDSCSGPDWRQCAVAALASALWKSHECWNSTVAEVA